MISPSVELLATLNVTTWSFAASGFSPKLGSPEIAPTEDCGTTSSTTVIYMEVVDAPMSSCS